MGEETVSPARLASQSTVAPLAGQSSETDVHEGSKTTLKGIGCGQGESRPETIRKFFDACERDLGMTIRWLQRSNYTIEEIEEALSALPVGKE